MFVSWSANCFPVLQVDFTDEALLQNISAFVGALLGAKPVGLKKSEFTLLLGCSYNYIVQFSQRVSFKRLFVVVL